MIREILVAMRPAQWIKNLFVFAPLIFSENLLNAELFFRSFAASVIFCAASSAVYLVNDISDLEEDRCHPEKSKRPLAAGRLSVRSTAVAAVVLICLSNVLAWLLTPRFLVIVVAYLILSLIYSFYLKVVVILDVMLIAAGFVLRVLAGSFTVSEPISHWMLLCTALIALFLGFCKRRHELLLQETETGESRKVLSHYSPYFLDQMISVVTASTVMSYALYTLSEEPINRFQTPNLIYTTPFVLYGIFRYLYLVHQKERGGSPTRIMVTDRPMVLNIILWVLAVVWVIYV